MTFKNDLPELTRREFVKIGAAGVAAIVSGGKALSMAATPDRMFEHGDPLKEFQYSEVQFQPGLHQAQLEQTHAILMGLDEDSLLRPFRLRGGFPAPGFELGGWYSSNGRDPGHTLGQWVSALSRYYAITRDEKTKEKIHRLVRSFAGTIEPSGKFYEDYSNGKLGADTEGSYTYMLLVGGLADAHALAHDPAALEVLARLTDIAMPHFPQKIVDVEPGIDWGFMSSDNQFTAWQQGAPDKHLQLAKQYLHREFLDALARGENALPTRHAYGHVSALCSAAKAYLVLGDETCLRAAKNGFAFVEAQSFATGGWGPSEHFIPRPVVDYSDPETGEKVHIPAINSLGDSLLQKEVSFETGCGSYAHFRLTRYLLRITQNPQYGDSMERVMYNAALGMKPLHSNGDAFYYSNYFDHAHKTYLSFYGGQEVWPCCSGTLPQLATDYHISTYFRDQQGVYVNLFIPSTVRWEQGGAKLSLTQSGQYPLDDRIVFEVAASRSARFSVRLRIPGWAQQPAVRINGKPISDPVRSGTFATIQREWKSGDRIELELPRRLELKAADPQHPDLVALAYGPLVLFAISDDTPKVTRAQLLAAKQQGQGSAEWHVDTNDGSLRLSPFWAIKDETYFTYLRV
jgi:DUF1680 family protein